MNALATYLKINYQNAVDFCAVLLVFFIPISTALPNLLIIPLLVVVSIFFKEYVLVRPTYLIAIVTSVLFILTESIVKNNFILDLFINSRYLLLLLIIILFTQVKGIYKVEHSFVLSTFIAVIGSSVGIIKQILRNPDFLLDSGRLVNELLWLERPYFGFILTLGIFICFKNAEKRPKHRVWYFLIIIVFVCFSIYISARLSVLLNIILIFTFLYRSSFIKKKIKKRLALGLFLFLIIVIGFNDSLKSRMQITDNMDHTIHLFKAYEPRFIIWPCAIKIFQQDLILLRGVDGRQVLEETLVECYKENTKEIKEKQTYYLKEKFNSHNQFLDFLLIGGIIPFVLLFSGFILTWISKINSIEIKVLMFLFFVFFLVENVLQRQLGVFLFGIFLSIYSKKENNLSSN